MIRSQSLFWSGFVFALLCLVASGFIAAEHSLFVGAVVFFLGVLLLKVL